VVFRPAASPVTGPASTRVRDVQGARPGYRRSHATSHACSRPPGGPTVHNAGSGALPVPGGLREVEPVGVGLTPATGSGGVKTTTGAASATDTATGNSLEAAFISVAAKVDQSVVLVQTSGGLGSGVVFDDLPITR